MTSRHGIASAIPVRLQWEIKKLSNIHIQGPLSNIFIFSTARSGSALAEQWIKEGKHAINWTRLSCHSFRNNAMRLP